MRSEREQEIALECLKLACSQPSAPDTVELAAQFLAFVTDDDAASVLAAVRAAVSS